MDRGIRHYKGTKKMSSKGMIIMYTQLLIGAIIFIIVVSLQLTLNLILKELRELKDILRNKYK